MAACLSALGNQMTAMRAGGKYIGCAWLNVHSTRARESLHDGFQAFREANTDREQAGRVWGCGLIPQLGELSPPHIQERITSWVVTGSVPFVARALVGYAPLQGFQHIYDILDWPFDELRPVDTEFVTIYLDALGAGCNPFYRDDMVGAAFFTGALPICSIWRSCDTGCLAAR